MYHLQQQRIFNHPKNKNIFEICCNLTPMDQSACKIHVLLHKSSYSKAFSLITLTSSL